METVTVSTSQLLELASELAHERAMDNLFAEEEILREEQAFIQLKDGTLIYTDIAQEYFNMSYDYYLSRIESILK